mmetsp:Transcript_872/g.2761  ORF Transcript_872/g.2761 Transcript_872/m.2761 type:complete len:407 (+) Transcript_872:289-1509(+)
MSSDTCRIAFIASCSISSSTALLASAASSSSRSANTCGNLRWSCFANCAMRSSLECSRREWRLHKYGAAACDMIHWWMRSTSGRMISRTCCISRCLLLVFSSCTCFKSSTLYNFADSTSAQSVAMFDGMQMSTSITACSRFCRCSALRITSLLPVAAKTTSLSATTSAIRSMGMALAFDPPRPLTSGIANNCSAFSNVRFTTVTCTSGSLLNNAINNSLDISPAPRIQTRTFCASLPNTAWERSNMSSTATLETDTEPKPMRVSVLARLPTRTASIINLEMILPPLPATSPDSSSPRFWQCWWLSLTCAKICPSPRTNESNPALTSKTWLIASSPECVNKYWSSSSRDKPDLRMRKAFTHSNAAWRLNCWAAKYNSKRLQVDKTATSGTKAPLELDVLENLTSSWA